MMFSNGNSFGSGQSYDLGSGSSYNRSTPEGRPVSANWLFTVLIFRLGEM